MPRTKREESATKIYNVGIKGANSQAMFFDEEDREKLLEAIEVASENCEVGVAARVFMSNHVHMVLHGELDNMARFFKSIGARYVGYFNRKYGRTGPLWNARYYSEGVLTPEAYQQVTAYIFNNPVAAGIAKSPFEYAWSNFHALCNGDAPHARALLAEAGDPDEILLYALDYSEAKLAENPASALEVFPKIRVCDMDLIEFIKDFFKGRSVAHVVAESEEEQRDLLENMLDLGSNVNQMSRVTGINRGRIVALLK